MLKNYLKIAVRNLMKRKVFSLINILGLATGMAICLLIVLFVKSELGYDRHHEKADRIYRLVLERVYPERSSLYSMIPASIGSDVQSEFPEVKESVRLINFTGNNNFYLKVGELVYEDRQVFAADSNFFRVFSGNFLAGDKATALKQPNAIVLSESMAKRMFGSAVQALGRQVQTDGDNENNNTFHITGVVEDWPENSHFNFNVLIASSSFDFLQQPNYISFSSHTYLLLEPNASAKALESKLPGIIEKYVAGDIAQAFGQSWADFRAAGNNYRYFLQPLTDIHLTSEMEAELSVNGSIKAIYIFSVVAVFILFLACINFINLSKFNNGTPVTIARVSGDNLQATLRNIEATWNQFIKDRPINYSFMDETLARQYLAEQRTQKIFSIFSSLAIFIACIGLLGLVAYTTQQRTREISIRKVLGASAGTIIHLLLKDFLKLVLIASLLAFPIAWWGMHQWLEDFAYRIDIPFWVFILAGVLAALVAFLTISYQAVRAATANPIKNLRTE